MPLMHLNTMRMKVDTAYNTIDCEADKPLILIKLNEYSRLLIAQKYHRIYNCKILYRNQNFAGCLSKAVNIRIVHVEFLWVYFRLLDTVEHAYRVILGWNPQNLTNAQATFLSDLILCNAIFYLSKFNYL